MALALGLALFCCGPTHFQYTRFPVSATIPNRIIPVYIEASFGNEDLLSINDSIDRWNYALNGYIVMKVVGIHSDFSDDERVQVYARHGLLIHKTNTSDPAIPKQKIEGNVTIAWTNRINGHEIYLVRDRLGRDDIFPVMLHEIGHYLGADHSHDGLMNPQYSMAEYQCIDQPTIKQVSKANGLDSTVLNYCLYCMY